VKVLSILTLSLAGLMLVSCGGGSYRSYDHDVVYRTPAYDDRYYYRYDDDDDVDVDYDYDDDDDDVVYYRYVPAPASRYGTIYGDEPYYYYRD
jgi:hypothetical protein